jgi:hypothetical protein
MGVRDYEGLGFWIQIVFKKFHHSNGFLFFHHSDGIMVVKFLSTFWIFNLFMILMSF